MAQQIINTGVADKGNGDPIRTAFTKVNANFTELFNHVSAGVVVGITPPETPGEGDLWWDPESGRLYVSYDENWVDASPVDGAGINSTNELVNGNKTVSLATTGILTLPSSSYLESTDINLKVGAQGTVTIRSNAASNLTTREWEFDTKGTLTVPNLLPRTFTATIDDAHYAGALALTGSAWFFEITFDTNSDGTVETLISNNPWPSNPGYTNGMEFTFTEADHGVPGYTFTLTLNSIQNPNPNVWTTNFAVSQPPAYPATIKNGESIKLTADATSFTFGADGKIHLPTDGDIVDSAGNSVLGANTGNISFDTGGTAAGIYNNQGGGVFISNFSYLTAEAETAWIEIPEGNGTNALRIVQEQGNVGVIATDKVWTFGADGSLTAPGTISAKTTLTLETTDLDAVYETYQGLIAQLTDQFLQAEYTGQGYPASKDSYEALVRAKALNPLIPDIWLPIASSLRNAYFVWAASSITLTVDGGGFVIANGGGVSWRFDEATGLRFPNNTYQTTAFTGSATRLLSPNTNYNLTANNAGVQTNSPVKWVEGTDERVILNYVSGDDRFVIATNFSNIGNERYWFFGDNGTLTLPSGAGFGLGETGQLKVNDSTTTLLDFRDATGRGFYTNNDGFSLRGDGDSTWLFKTNGNLQLPAGGDIVDSTGTSVLGGGSNLKTIQTVSTTGSEVLITGDVVLADPNAAGGAVQLRLPNAPPAGTEVTVKNINTGAYAVYVGASIDASVPIETEFGLVSASAYGSLAATGNSITWIFDGTAWRIIHKNMT